MTSERGAAAVEFALVVSLLLLLVFGIVQYGWTFYQQQEAAQAVREGARIASVSTSERSGVEALVRERIVTATGEDVCVFYTDQDGNAKLSVGDEITVRGSFTATDFNFPFVPFPSGLSIDQEATTRAEASNPSKWAADQLYPATASC